MIKTFMITEIYLYHDDSVEKLCFSSGDFERLFVLNNVFSDTKLSLSFSGCNGYDVEEFIY